MTACFNLLIFAALLVGVIGFVSAVRTTYHVRPEARSGSWSPTELLFRPSALTERGRSLRKTWLVCAALFVLLWLMGWAVAQFLPREST